MVFHRVKRESDREMASFGRGLVLPCLRFVAAKYRRRNLMGKRNSVTLRVGFFPRQAKYWNGISAMVEREVIFYEKYTLFELKNVEN